jgi:GT2 family glycosyltransferase
MRVSVIVPTRDRPQYLSRCLTALAGQTLAKEDYEVIVVDDGSSPPAVLPATAAGPKMTIVRRDRPGGPAAARNEVLALASGAVVAFTDDDCRADREWLEEGCRAVERGLDIATGPTIPDPRDRDAAGPFDYSMEVPGPDPRFSTCNCFYRASVLRAAGGFRDAFNSSAGYHLGEDTDLAWRAIEAGGRAGFAERAVVYHAIRPCSFAEHLRARRRLENVVPLVKRHPGAGKAQPSPHLYSWTHLLVYVALAGVLASFRTPWALLAITPYLAWRSRDKRHLVRAPWLFLWCNRTLPHRLIADLYECFVLARASARHRYLVI